MAASAVCCPDSSGGLEPTWRGPLSALHERIVRGLGEVVGIVGDQVGSGEDERVEHRAIAVTGGLEGSDVGLDDHPSLASDFSGELAERFELFVSDGAPLTDGSNSAIVGLRYAGEVGISRHAGHAVGALVLIDDSEVGNLALLRRELRLLGNAPKGAIGFQRRWTLGE